MPYKPCCAKCGREYTTKEIGVGVLEYKGDGTFYRISAADLLECPECGHEITYGYGNAIHYSAEPQRVTDEIVHYEKNKKLIKVYPTSPPAVR